MPPLLAFVNTTVLQAKHAYDWTTQRNQYPVAPVGDAVVVAKAMWTKYAPYFAGC